MFVTHLVDDKTLPEEDQNGYHGLNGGACGSDYGRSNGWHNGSGKHFDLPFYYGTFTDIT